MRRGPGNTVLCDECERKLATQPLVSHERSLSCVADIAERARRTSLNWAGMGNTYAGNAGSGCWSKDGGLRDLLQQAVRGLREKTTLAIAGYEIGEVLGKGGMGIVYRAIRKSDQCPLAIKAMLPSIAINEESRRRFLREIDILRQLEHPHIVQAAGPWIGRGRLLLRDGLLQRGEHREPSAEASWKARRWSERLR